MLVAALDTATLTLSCALVDVATGAPPRLRSSRSDPAPAKGAPGATGGHGGRLPGVLVELLQAEGLSIPDLIATERELNRKEGANLERFASFARNGGDRGANHLI